MLNLRKFLQLFHYLLPPMKFLSLRLRKLALLNSILQDFLFYVGRTKLSKPFLDNVDQFLQLKFSLKNEQHRFTQVQIVLVTISYHQNFCCKMSVRHCPSDTLKSRYFSSKNISQTNH